MKQNQSSFVSGLTSLLITVSLFTSSMMSGCDHQQDDNNPTDQTPQAIAVDHVWKSEYYHYPENIRGSLNNYSIEDHVLSFSGTRVISEEPYKTEPVMISFDLEKYSFDVSAAPETPSEEQRYSQFLFQYEEGTIQVYSEYDALTGSENCTVVRYDADNSVIWEIDAKSQFQKLSSDRPWFYLNNVLQNSQTGTIYLCTDQNIAAISSDGKRLYEVSVENYLQNIFASADGTVYATFYEWDMTTGDGAMKLVPLDDEKQSFGEALPLPATVDLQNANIYAAPGYDIFYSNDHGLFSWNVGDENPTMLCNWVNSDLTAQDARSLILISDSLALRTDYDPVSGTPQLCVMTPVDPEDIVPKYLIEVAYIENGSNEIQNFAVAFNRESDTYRVILKDYSSYEITATAAEVLQRDIIAGDIPDIIIDDNNILGLEALSEKGLFRDLYSYMDAPNAEMTREDFLPCVLKPFETSKGTLPVLVSGFCMRTLYGNTDVVGDRQKWSFDDILTLQESLSSDQYLFSMYLSTDPDAQTDTASRLLNTLLPLSLSAFIDEENGTCSFDDGRFAELLQFCQTCPILNAAELENGTTEKFRDGTLLLLEETNLFEISDYLKRKYYDFGGDGMTVIGYPTADETAISGTAIEPLRKYAITEDSLVADGAWEFIMRTFGDPDTDFYYHRNGFPSARKALESLFEEEARSYYVFSHNGWSGTTLDEGDEFVAEENEWIQQEIANGGVFGHMSEEDEAEFRAILENISLVADSDEQIMDLIREDASAYFAGAKTLEETVNVIQSRVSIYVAEHQ